MMAVKLGEARPSEDRVAAVLNANTARWLHMLQPAPGIDPLEARLARQCIHADSSRGCFEFGLVFGAVLCFCVLCFCVIRVADP